jgi:hypothetical protein
MPRQAENTIQLNGPFGGLKVAQSSQRVSPLDCIDCLNVHTAFGDIRRRPGYRQWNNIEPQDNERPAKVIAPARINNDPLMVVWGSSGTNQDTHVTIWSELDENNGERKGRSWGETEQGSWILPPSIVQAMNRIYVINWSAGGCRKYYYDGSAWREKRIGLPMPDDVVATESTGGGLHGEHNYRVTFYDPSCDVESGPSTVEDSLDFGPDQPGNGRAVITVRGDIIRNGSEDHDPDIHVRLYHKGENDATWYLLDELDQSVGYPIQFEHTVQGFPVLKPFENRIPLFPATPPPSHIAEWHQRRMWYAVGLNGWGAWEWAKQYPTTVRYSELDEPERVNPNAALAFDVGTDDYITQMKSFGGLLYVFKTKSIWIVNGTSPAGFYSQKIIDGVGCTAKQSVTAIGGSLYFCNHDGAYRLTGSKIEYISQDIEPLWAYWEKRYLNRLQGTHHPDLGLYIINGVKLGDGFEHPEPGPIIEVLPPELNFGTVEIGERVRDDFTVKNIGYEELEGEATGLEPPFRLVHHDNTYSLGPNETRRVDVEFAPTAPGLATDEALFSGGGGSTNPVSGEGVGGSDPPPDRDPSGVGGDLASGIGGPLGPSSPAMGGNPGMQLVYNYRTHKWYLWNLPATVLMWQDWNEQSGGDLFFAIRTGDADHGQNLARVEGTKDNGENVPWNWTTGDLDFGTTRPKKLYFMSLSTDKGGSVPVVVTSARDGGRVGILAKEVTPGDLPKNTTITHGRTFKTLRVVVGISGDDAETRVTGLGFDLEPVGYRP